MMCGLFDAVDLKRPVVSWVIFENLGRRRVGNSNQKEIRCAIKFLEKLVFYFNC